MATMLELHAELPEPQIPAEMIDLATDGLILVAVAIILVVLGSLVVSLCRRARDWAVGRLDHKKLAALTKKTERDILHL